MKTIRIKLTKNSTQNPNESIRKNKNRIKKEVKDNDNPIVKKDDDEKIKK